MAPGRGPMATRVILKYRKTAQDVACKMVYIDLHVDTDCIEEYSAAVYIPGNRICSLDIPAG